MNATKISIQDGIDAIGDTAGLDKEASFSRYLDLLREAVEVAYPSANVVIARHNCSNGSTCAAEFDLVCTDDAYEFSAEDDIRDHVNRIGMAIIESGEFAILEDL